MLYAEVEDRIRCRSVTGVQTCAFVFSSRRRHTRLVSDWSSDVCSSDLPVTLQPNMAEGVSRTGGLGNTFGHVGLQSNRINDAGVTRSSCEPKIGRASCRERV